jgi:Domain of Unknown Function (DUF1206)
MGFTARGVLYTLIGWVAILAALGQSSHEAHQEGALQLLAAQSCGLASLWLLGIGAGYALWRLSEAAFGVAGDGNARVRGHPPQVHEVPSAVAREPADATHVGMARHDRDRGAPPSPGC